MFHVVKVPQSPRTILYSHYYFNSSCYIWVLCRVCSYIPEAPPEPQNGSLIRGHALLCMIKGTFFVWQTTPFVCTSTRWPFQFVSGCESDNMAELREKQNLPLCSSSLYIKLEINNLQGDFILILQSFSNLVTFDFLSHRASLSLRCD